MERRVLRIAHAHGNRRHRIEEALAAGVDFIEADMRYHRDRIWVRHELRLPALPILYNGHINRFHRQGPWALSLRRLFLRLDIAPIPLDELLDTVGASSGLFVDLKTAPYPPAVADRFVDTLLNMLDTWFHGPVRMCGNWDLLDLVTRRRPTLPVHYSIDRDKDWRRFRSRLDRSASPPAITLRKGMLDDERARFLRGAGVEYICWDVESFEEAQRAIDLGASGIISHHLDVLKQLASPPQRNAEAS